MRLLFGYFCSILLLTVIGAEEESSTSYEAYLRSHPEESSGKFEGDIVLKPNQTGFRNVYSRATPWTRGIVYYDMSAMSSHAQYKIRSALDALETKTGGCVQFQQRTNQGNYIKIINGNGCYSYVGMLGGKQELSLAEYGCLGEGTIQHEFIHALGFMHEQCRSDRDKYLTIHWENIEKSKQSNFDKSNTNNQNLIYVYGSIMHYGEYSFSKNGKPTMTPKDPRASIGIRRLHNRDVEMIKRLYNCPSAGVEHLIDDCDCDYHSGGCAISTPSPANRACNCIYKGAWTCGGEVTLCKDPYSTTCVQPDKSHQSCLNGGGDCLGYKCDCDYKNEGCIISEAPVPGTACKCAFKGIWTCQGYSVRCRDNKAPKCLQPDKSYETCVQGGGDCVGY